MMGSQPLPPREGTTPDPGASPARSQSPILGQHGLVPFASKGRAASGEGMYRPLLVPVQLRPVPHGGLPRDHGLF